MDRSQGCKYEACIVVLLTFVFSLLLCFVALLCCFAFFVLLFLRLFPPLFLSRARKNEKYIYKRLDQVLSTRRYLAGDRVTLSDVRVFPSLARFDEVYNVYFKCNKKRLVDYPNILNYVRDLYQSYPDGFAATTDMDHIRVRKTRGGGGCK